MSAVIRLNPAPFVVDIRRGAVRDLGALISERGLDQNGSVAVVVGPGLGAQIADELSQTLGHAEVMQLTDIGTLTGAERIAEELVRSGHRTVIGIGGGRTLDTAKLAAARSGVSMVAVATNLAHDGLASPVAVLEHEGRRTSYAAVSPVAIIVDLDYVRAAPKHLIRAGVGDVVSNIVAVADWELAHDVTGEEVNGLAAMLARTAAESVLHRTDLESDDFFAALADALVVSGFAMLVAGSSRPCSGSDHEISHAIDKLFPDTASHGEQVGVATLFSLVLRDDLDRADQVERCLRRHGLPVLPADLGLTDAQFAMAVLQAPATRPDRFTILEHLMLDHTAIQAILERVNTRYAR